MANNYSKEYWQALELIKQRIVEQEKKNTVIIRYRL